MDALSSPTAGGVRAALASPFPRVAASQLLLAHPGIGRHLGVGLSILGRRRPTFTADAVGIATALNRAAAPPWPHCPGGLFWTS